MVRLLYYVSRRVVRKRKDNMAEFVKNHPKENLLIVDALNLCFRWKPYKANERVSSFAADFVDTVSSLARSYSCGQIVVAADMKGSSYRREIYPDYKANRKVTADAQTEAEKAQSQQFFAEYEKALEAADKKFLLLRYPGVEADDIAAYIVTKRYLYGYDSIWLISSDRDWDLLVKDDVSRFSTVTRKEITLETWPHEVPPEHYLSFKCLTGDKGDNIPGVTGVGPKRAAGLIEEFGSALDVCDAIPLPGKLKYIQAVNDSKDQIFLNHELMDLETFCEEAIGSDNVRDIGQKLIMNDRRLTGYGF
jgi:DNA polymerase-1